MTQLTLTGWVALFGLLLGGLWFGGCWIYLMVKDSHILAQVRTTLEDSDNRTGSSIHASQGNASEFTTKEKFVSKFSRFMWLSGRFAWYPFSVPVIIVISLGFLFLSSISLVSEVLIELAYQFTLWIRTESCRSGPTAEASPLLGTGKLPVSQPCQNVRPGCAYSAVDINSVDLRNLRGGILVRDLPIQKVCFPVSDISNMAVLSWRWDFDDEGRSRNLASAIKYARTVGICYMFVDTISIDQSLESSELMRRVQTFCSLFTTIPVLAAYDQKGGSLEAIMHRPWIFREMQLFTQNPTKLVYIGHNKQGCHVNFSAFSFYLGRPARSQLYKTNFYQNYLDCCSGDYVKSVLHNLNGENGMAKVSDFKFIMPSFVEAFTKAEKLSRNDYLLTVVLLASAVNYGSNLGNVVQNRFTTLQYETYRIEKVDTGTNPHWYSHEPGLNNQSETYKVLLGDKKLGAFHCHHGDGEYPVSLDDKDKLLHHWIMITYPNAESDILDMLDLDDIARERYVSRKGERRASLSPPAVRGLPEIEVVAVTI